MLLPVTFSDRMEPEEQPADKPTRCGRCEKCMTEWPAVDGGPFSYVGNDDLRLHLERWYGLCMDSEPAVVELYGDMPCGGDGFVAADWYRKALQGATE